MANKKEKIEEVMEEEVMEEVKEEAAEVVEETEPEKEQVTEEEPKKKSKNKIGVIVNCSALRVRLSPNMKSPEIGRFEKNQEVRIVMENNTENFYCVVFGEREGFCAKEFIALR